MSIRDQKTQRMSDLLIDYLRQERVEYIFGITGKTISPIFDSALDLPDIHTITPAHEGGVAYMAYGYAQATGKLGVCCATTGGGITNLLSGVASGYVHSLPMLVITGQVPRAQFGKNAFQESTGYGQTMDAVEMLKPITKESFLLHSPDKAQEAIHYAMRSALTGRKGPVHINIPIDVQLAEVPNYFVTPRNAFIPQNLPACSEEAISQSLELIASSKRPVFLMGWGAVFSHANACILELAELLNIPIATTVQGKGGISSDHPLYLGVMGLGGHTKAIEYILETSDLLIAVGTSFGEFNTLNWQPKLQENKKIIQIDIDPTEIGKNYPVDVGLVGDASEIMLQLLKTAKNKPIAAKKFTRLKGWEWCRCLEEEKTISQKSPILPQTLLREIRENTPANTLFIADSSAHWCWVNHYMPILNGGMYYPTQGLGSMGTGIASSIGIKLARPNHPVVCVCGDGSFLMQGSEVATAVHYSIPVTWVIFNDQRYAMPYLGTEKLYGKGRAEGPCSLPKVDFAKVAEGYGAKAYSANKPGDLKTILSEVLKLKKPTVIDVRIDIDEIPPVGERLKYG